MSEWRLSLAGLPVRVRAHGAVLHDHVEARFGAFQRCPWDDDLPGWSLDARAEPGWAPPRPVQSPLPGADTRWIDPDRLELLRTYDLTTMNFATRHSDSVGRPSVANAPVVDPTVLDTPLRYIASLALPRHQGLLMHASGYADARGAALFLAVSGGGKTTTARKLPHPGVLSDDQVALRRIDGAWIARALPFVGEYRRATAPHGGPLRALALLAKGDALSLRPVSAAEAIGPLLRCAVSFAPGPHAAAMLDLAADLAARVPVVRLTLARDTPMDACLDALLGGGAG